MLSSRTPTEYTLASNTPVHQIAVGRWDGVLLYESEVLLYEYMIHVEQSHAH